MSIKNEWFATWFNSPLYHLLYKDRNEEEATFFINHLIEILLLDEEDRVLDLACGKGRHAKMIAAVGPQVVGVDLSPESIAHAKQFQSSNLQFAVQDMRHLTFEEPFDYVFNFFTSFGYFSDLKDNLKTVQAVARNMTEGGTFVIDFLNAKKVKKHLVESERKVIEGYQFDIERKIEESIIIKTITVTKGIQKQIFEERVQALQLNDFKFLLEGNGFSIKKVAGDYDLSPFDLKESNRLIIFAKKK